VRLRKVDKWVEFFLNNGYSRCDFYEQLECSLIRRKVFLRKFVDGTSFGMNVDVVDIFDELFDIKRNF